MEILSMLPSAGEHGKGMQMKLVILEPLGIPDEELVAKVKEAAGSQM